MGAKTSQQKSIDKITPQLLQQSFNIIRTNQDTLFTKQQIIKHIKIILHSLRDSDPVQLIQQQLVANPQFIKFIYSSKFTIQMKKIVQLFISELENTNKKSLNFLKVTQVNDLTAIADFILYFSGQKIMQIFDSLLVRSDVDQGTKKLLKQIQKQQNQGQLQINGNLVQKMSEQQLQTIQKTLRVTIISFINLRQQMISRSQSVLRTFGYFQQSLFMLYTKLYFSHSNNLQTKLQSLNQHYKSNTIIGSYFLSAGTSYIQPSLYETAVVFLYSYLKINGIQHKEMKQLPSHLFKNLPVIPTHSIYQYILCTILFTLKYVKQGQQTYIRFSFNRLMSLKLVQLLIKVAKIHNKTVTYYLQQLCLQVKVGQIQRACVYQIIQLYNSINNNLGIPQSQIFKKFLQTGNLKYNLKFTNKQIKISKQQLLTQLEDDQDTCKKQYNITSHKYVIQRILFRAVTYNFNDRLLWSQILPNIMNNKQDEEVRTQSKIKYNNNNGESDQEDHSQEQGHGENKDIQIGGGGEDQEKRQQISVLEQPEEHADNKMEKVQ